MNVQTHLLNVRLRQTSRLHCGYILAVIALHTLKLHKKHLLLRRKKRKIMLFTGTYRHFNGLVST